ncbi:hypothetical protein LCGC14_0535240 [marine sediment metagenome]|uniref:Uncharacterized protein n=1 Tax=marine sediment metagenome TaxID=412755 RepID=A0A0F9UFY4_9ZZZZ
MVEVADAFNVFLEENLTLLVFAIGTPIALLYLYKYLRSVPKQVDYISIFKDRTVTDEQFNKPDKRFGVKTIWRGNKILGKVLTFSSTPYKSVKKTDTAKTASWDRKAREKIMVHTVTFKPIMFQFLGIEFMKFKKEILKFTDLDSFVIDENNKLIFPSNVSFNSLGSIYVTMNSYPQLSRIIEDDFNKRLFEVNTQLFASKMTQISAETPEMSHELALKRLEIEKIKQDKMMKLGNII